MFANKIKKIAIAITLVLMTVSVYAKGKMVPVSADWKMKYGDDLNWINISSDSLDSTWKSVQMPSPIALENPKGFWLKASVKIPAEFKNQPVYFETGNSYGAMEIYINGTMVGHHGTVTPDINFSHVSNTVASIPSGAIKNGTVDISIRCNSEGSHQTFNQFFIVDQARYSTVALVQPLFNNYVYYMMAAICIFLGIYFMFQFFANKKDKTSLTFSLTLVTVAFYFLDMASEILYLPFNIQLSIARCCFVYSIGCLVLFIRHLFGLKVKVIKYIIFAVWGAITLAYVFCANNTTLLENLFTISLLPVFVGVIYLYVVLIKARKTHAKNARSMLLGISFAMIFAFHDIFYQVIGVIPFAWLQGFSFFFIDITMFIVVSMESVNNKRQINDLVLSTSDQKDKLNVVIENAARLSSETMEIADRLNEAVKSVAEAAQDSELQALSIGDFIEKQNDSMRQTTNAVEKLLASVETVSNEVKIENEVVSSAVNETKLLVEGVGQATVGIENAADFAQSLGQLTAKSSNDIGSLVKVLEDIKTSSAEILNVIKVVSDFSRKTNMLAMNASIEAAHSGDAGKGFAVIAHEINNLAGASGSQTEKITDIVTAITENISKSFDLSIGVKQILEQVAEGAETTSAKVTESAQGMEAQRQAGGRITDATNQMDSSAQKVQAETMRQTAYSMLVSTNMQELSKFAQDAEQAVKEVVNRNKELSSQATELQNLATRIKEASSDLDKLMRL